MYTVVYTRYIMVQSQIYFLYSHDYKTGYVGRTRNLKNRYCGHALQGAVCNFANETHVPVRRIFDMYAIYTCDDANASGHEARVYWLIKHNFPHIELLNKNIPNRTTIDWVRDNPDKRKIIQHTYYLRNKDAITEHQKRYRAEHLEHYKEMQAKWRAKNHEYVQYYLRAWAMNNRDKLCQYVKKWQNNNSDYLREYQKQYRLNNADKIKEINKRFRLNNADQLKEKRKQYRLNNADIIKARSKQYRLNNADKIKESRKQYRINKIERAWPTASSE